MSFTHYRTKGFVFKKEDKGEADQVFSVFTEDFGKLQILGKGIRKITSKLRSGADLFYFSEIEFIQGKNYKTLTDAVLLQKFKNIESDSEKFEVAFKIADVLDLFIGQEEKDEKIWQLLAGILEALDKSYKLQVTSCKIYYYFLWNLFKILGYAPGLYNCSVCGEKILPETIYFIPCSGGLISWQCAKDLKSLEPINVGTIKILRIFLKNGISIIFKLKTEKGDVKNLERISEIYLEFLRSSIYNN